jgi:hypothetical protein
MTTAQALRDAFDAFIRINDAYKRALEEIATGRSGEGDAVDVDVMRTIARRALGHLPAQQ